MRGYLDGCNVVALAVLLVEGSNLMKGSPLDYFHGIRSNV